MADSDSIIANSDSSVTDQESDSSIANLVPVIADPDPAIADSVPAIADPELSQDDFQFNNRDGEYYFTPKMIRDIRDQWEWQYPQTPEEELIYRHKTAIKLMNIARHVKM